jgi:hypothetical protein
MYMYVYACNSSNNLLPSSLNNCPKSNSSRWSKFHPLYQAIGGGVKIFFSPKHNLLQQFPYSPPPTHGSHRAMSASPSPPQIRDFWPPARSNSTTGTHLQPEAVAATTTLPLMSSNRTVWLRLRLHRLARGRRRRRLGEAGAHGRVFAGQRH